MLQLVTEFVKIWIHIYFVVSELVVGSGEQDKMYAEAAVKLKAHKYRKMLILRCYS